MDKTMKNVEIKFLSSVRCKTRKDVYYQVMFSDFKAERIFVSEFAPGSKRNFGYDARFSWSPATYEQAKRFFGEVFFKNASLYGAACFYIKDRLGR